MPPIAAHVVAMLLQAAAPAAASPPGRFSILDRRCVSDNAEVVVCGRQPERLPLPGERGPPDRPMPANPDMIPEIALAPVPCGARQGGCQVGVDVVGMGVAAIRLIGKAIDPDSCCEAGEATDPVALAKDMAGSAKRAFGRKPDKSGRVPIALDAPPPSLAGRLSR